jgi:hypothetical protein
MRGNVPADRRDGRLRAREYGAAWECDEDQYLSRITSLTVGGAMVGIALLLAAVSVAGTPDRVSRLESFISTDGGVSYRGPARIAHVFNHFEAGDLRSPALPTAGVDGAGGVYVAWSDCRFRRSCSGNDIVFSSSSDGTHWTPVRRVPIDAKTSGVDHFLPGLGVATNTSGRTGRLAVTYYYY